MAKGDYDMKPQNRGIALVAAGILAVGANAATVTIGPKGRGTRD